IGPGVETVAALLQFRTKLGEVINLAVEYDPGTAVFVEYGLVAAGKIDDAEAPHAKPRAIGHVQPFVIGTAIDDLLAHVVHKSFGNIALTGCAHHSGNSAHLGFLPFHADTYHIDTAQPTLTGTESAFPPAIGRSLRSLKR